MALNISSNNSIPMNSMSAFIKIFLASIYFFAVMETGAQEICIRIKKGMALVNNTIHNTTEKSIAIKDGDTVTVNQNSLVIARMADKMAELKSGSTYSEKQIRELLKKKTATFTYDFLNVIFSEPLQKPGQKPIGGLTRGGSGTLSDFFPEDDMIIISDRVLLDCGNDTCRLNGKLLVMNESTGEIVYNNVPEKNELLLNVKKPGTYSWEYTISCRIDKQEASESYTNTFVVPEAELKAKIISEIDAFKKNLLDLSPELLQECVNRYLIIHHYYSL
jgi:hypothetical protein